MRIGKEKIPEISLGRIEEQRYKGELIGLLKNLNSEIHELFKHGLHGLGTDEFQNRVKRTISKNQERFSRRFSLDSLIPESYLLAGHHHYIAVRLLSSKSTSDSNYYLGGFSFSFWMDAHGEESELSCCYSATFSLSGASEIESFEKRVVEKIDMDNSGLVLGYLHQGILKAASQIRNEVYGAMCKSLRESDARSLLDFSIRIMSDVKAREERIVELSQEWETKSVRITKLEIAIDVAIRKIKETRSSIKSRILESVREGLEASLKDDEPKESHGGMRIKS